jgi:hypothetical protein
VNSPRIQHVAKKRWIAAMNVERDWLKHPSGSRGLQLNRGNAAIMITRAASKLTRWSPQMKEFKKWLLRNIDII